MNKAIIVGVGLVVALGIGGYLLNKSAVEESNLGFNAGDFYSPTEDSIDTSSYPSTGNNVDNNTPPTTSGSTETATQCQEVVPYQFLIAAIPLSVGTYMTEEEPTGGTINLPAGDGTSAQLSEAKATLEASGNSDLYVSIAIQDICFIPQLKMAWDLMGSVSSSEVRNTKTTVSGFDAWEQFLVEDGSYKYVVMINNRVLISVDGA